MVLFAVWKLCGGLCFVLFGSCVGDGAVCCLGGVWAMVLLAVWELCGRWCFLLFGSCVGDGAFCCLGVM